MSKRKTAVSEENTSSGVGLEEEQIQELPPETRRTRSGRKVRTPASLLDSEAPTRTPSRRTRRSVLQEQPVEERSTNEKLNSLPEEKLGESAEPEPVCAEPEPVCAEPEPVCAEPEPVCAEPEPECAEPEPECAEPEQAVPHMEAAADGDGSGHGLPGSAPAETAPRSTESVPNKKPRLGSGGKQTPVIPLGKPKSGRVWKDRNKQRFSAVVRDKQLCSSWEKKMEAKREKEQVKRYSLQLKEDKARQKEEKRKRREDNLKRRAENERKAEIVQVIKNTSKIKRMKKKQLRRIEKRDTLAVLQKSQKQSVKAKVQKSPAVEQKLT